MAKTLFEYYKSKGQSLPGIKERSKTFEELGLGSAGIYKGTGEQNVALLKRLDTLPPTPAPKPPVSPAGSAGATPVAPNLPVSAPVEPKATISTPSTSVTDRYEKLLGDLETTFKNIPSKSKLYSEELTARNVEPQRQQLRSLDERIASMERAIGESEEDIRKRTIQSGGLVTESQTQRLVAAEKEPLIRSYKNLLDERNRIAQQIGEEESRAGTLAGLKYEEGLQPLESLKTRLGIEKDISELARGGKPLEVAGNLVQYNPKTGKYETVFEKPTSELDTLKLDLAIQRLEVAKQNATTASEKAELQNQINDLKLNLLKGQSASSPGQIVDAATGLPKKLTEEQLTNFTNYNLYLNDFIPRAKDLLAKVKTGGAEGRIIKYAATLPVAQRLLSQDQNELLSTIANMNNQLVYMLSGKQINETEYKRLLEQMPQLELTPEQNTIRIGRFERVMQEIRDGKLKLMGAKVAGDGAAAGGQTDDPLGIR